MSDKGMQYEDLMEMPITRRYRLVMHVNEVNKNPGGGGGTDLGSAPLKPKGG